MPTPVFPVLGRDAPLVIWGAGAMGGSIGGALARDGVKVLFVDQDRDHVRVMNEQGLRVTGPVSEFMTPVRATTPNEVTGSFPLIFLCVKSQHTPPAVAQLEPHLLEDGAVVSVQNGLCELEIAEVLGPSRTVGAFVNFGADYLAPGVIHRGNRGAVVVGEMNGCLSDRVRGIHQLLRVFEPDALLSENVFGFLWGKLAYAALLFATAVTNDSIADVLANKKVRPSLIALAGEAVAVALAKGVVLEGFDGFDPESFRPGGPGEKAELSIDNLVAFNRASAKSHSGIWRDLAVRKRTTEVDAQLGRIVSFGQEVGIPTPLTEVVVRQIHEIENGIRLQDWKNLEELRTST